MKVNSFQDRENVILGQAFTKHCQKCQALPSIAKHYQVLPNMPRALPSIAKHYKDIAKH